MYSENVDATFYTAIGWNGFNDSSECPKETRACIDTKFVYEDHADDKWGPLFLWWPTAQPEYGARINQGVDDSYTAEALEYREDLRFYSPCPVSDEFVRKARPTSYHPGGVNAVFAGGRALFLSENIDYITYISLMTPNDKKSLTPDPDYVLEDNHYL